MTCYAFANSRLYLDFVFATTYNRILWIDRAWHIFTSECTLHLISAFERNVKGYFPQHFSCSFSVSCRRHMLFLGTEKYPDEEEYDGFLNQNGGYSNAYTDMEDTNYCECAVHSCFCADSVPCSHPTYQISPSHHSMTAHYHQIRYPQHSRAHSIGWHNSLLHQNLITIWWIVSFERLIPNTAIP